MADFPDENARQVMDQVMAMPQGRATVTRLADKDDELRPFQRADGISERVAEAAIREWVMTHGRNFDWDLDEVKTICLRDQRDGIPQVWLPGAEKRRWLAGFQSSPPRGALRLSSSQRGIHPSASDRDSRRSFGVTTTDAPPREMIRPPRPKA